MALSHAGTGSSFAALETNSTHPYFSFPFSLPELPVVLKKGLIAPGLMGLISLLSSFGLLCFLLRRYFSWTKSAKSWTGYNQYLVLFINLLVADLQQAMSFVISFHWMATDSILAPTPACFAQGWLLNIGNVSSGVFVLFIALHTYYTTFHGRLSNRVFIPIVLGTWFFALLLTLIGPAIHGRSYFVRTGAWCWVSALYETERLTVHYVWIFLVQFGSMAVYVVLLVRIRAELRRTGSVLDTGDRTASSSSAAGTAATTTTAATHRKIDRAAKAMLLYPLAYILLTLPLSAGRMWSIAHQGAFLPSEFLLVAGSLLASSGAVDAVLYALTRRSLMNDDGRIRETSAGATVQTSLGAGGSASASASGGGTVPGGRWSVFGAGLRGEKVFKPAFPARTTSGGDEDDDDVEELGNFMQEKQGLASSHMRSSVSVVTGEAGGKHKPNRSSSVPVLPRHGVLGSKDWGAAREDSESSMGSASDQK